MATLVKVKALVEFNCQPGTTGVTHFDVGEEAEIDANIAEVLLAGRYVEQVGGKQKPAVPKRENE